jgi:environmental stress-induced protein Ves
MSWKLNHLDAIAPVPWRNGGGLTRELLAWPSQRDWTVRMSVAEVAASGPFSSFPGVHRWFAVLSGNGVKLRVADASHDLTVRSAPLEFAGAAATHCELLDGPTRDFNLMVRHRRARLERIAAARVFRCAWGTLVGAYAPGAGAILVCDGQRQDLPPDTFAWRILEADAQLELIANEALWMEVNT